MDLFYVLLVLLVVTRAFGELASRVGQPALVGELVSGIVLGTVVGHYAELFPTLSGLQADRVFDAINDLGMFFIMLFAGIEAFSEIPTFIVVLVVTTFVGKLLGAGLAAYAFGLVPTGAATVGIGMSARGAVEQVIADIALEAGIFSRPRRRFARSREPLLGGCDHGGPYYRRDPHSPEEDLCPIATTSSRHASDPRWR